MKNEKDLDRERLKIDLVSRLERHKKTVKQEEFRAQSWSIGKCGACSTEISLRGDDGAYLFTILHPADVVEAIHQLAANIGCHIHIQPRNDFASFREWKQPTEEDLNHLNGWTPFPGISRDHPAIGKGHLSIDRPFAIQNEQNKQRLKEQIKQELLTEMKNEEPQKDAVAVKKPVNRKPPKSSRRPTR